MEKKISREALIQDIRELTNIIENAHPDPYLKGGGRIAYHRRLQKLIRDVPLEGMTQREFFFHLQPFIAKIEDGHTTIKEAGSSVDDINPGGIPLIFDAIEEKLYVRAVTNEKYRPLIGCILISIEGVSFKEIVKRQKNRIGFENVYQLLSTLGNKGSLYYSDYLKQLIPEWSTFEQITVILRHTSGTEKEYSFPPAKNVQAPFIEQKTRIELPQTDNPFFFYHFIDPEKKIAFLRITNMITYRETYEYWEATGTTNFNDLARRVFKDFNDEEPPEDYKKVIEGIPTATETFLSLVKEMKRKKTKFLIVDLRKNSGGNDTMIQILLYFLVGFSKTISLLMSKTEIRKYSEFLNKTSEKGVGLKEVFYGKLVPMTINDYDFSYDPSFCPGELKQAVKDHMVSIFEKMASFNKEFKSGEYEGYYLPEKIVVLCSGVTFSSGFDLMTDLYRLGAVIVGIPSGQAGNSCGDIRLYELANSKLKGTISTKYFIAFPDDQEKGHLLKPHHPLTYEKFVSYNVDKNSILLYALDLIKEQI